MKKIAIMTLTAGILTGSQHVKDREPPSIASIQQHMQYMINTLMLPDYEYREIDGVLYKVFYEKTIQ